MINAFLGTYLALQPEGSNPQWGAVKQIESLRTVGIDYDSE